MAAALGEVAARFDAVEGLCEESKTSGGDGDVSIATRVVDGLKVVREKALFAAAALGCLAVKLETPPPSADFDGEPKVGEVLKAVDPKAAAVAKPKGGGADAKGGAAPAKAPAGKGAGGGKEESPHLIMTKVLKIEQEKKEALAKLVKDFYDRKGPRPVTRPNKVAPSLAEMNERNERALKEMVKNAEKFVDEKTRELRLLLATLDALMARVPPVIFSDLVKRADHVRKAKLSQVEGAFKDFVATSRRLRDANGLALKPILARPGLADELAALRQREAARSEETRARIAAQFEIVRAAEDAYGERVTYAAAHGATVLLGTFDALPQLQHLVPTADDIPAKRKSLKTLLRQQQRDASKPAAAALGPGQPFPTRTVGGVPVGELTWAAATADPPAQPAGTTAAVECDDTTNHATVQRARDKTFELTRGEFRRRVAESKSRLEGMARDEELWLAYWMELLRTLEP